MSQHRAFPCQPRIHLERSINTLVSRLSFVGKRCQGQPREVGNLLPAMPDADGRSVDARSRGEDQCEERGEREIEVLQRTVGEQRLRAQKDTLLAEAGRGAGGGRRGEAAVRESTPTTLPTPGQGAQSGTSQIYLCRQSLAHSKPPKLDNVEAHFGMWRRKSVSTLSSSEIR